MLRWWRVREFPYFEVETRQGDLDMNRSRATSPILAVTMIVILTTLEGCALYGVRPDIPPIEFQNPYDDYKKVRQFAVEMAEAYDSRATFNRGAIYGGSTTPPASRRG